MFIDPHASHAIQDALDSCREAVYERLVAEAEVTETEATGAREQVGHMVDAARAHAEDIQQMLDGIEDDGGLPQVVAEQSREMRDYLEDVQERLDHVVRLAETAAEACRSIQRIGNRVEQVSMSARILGISANVEASRLTQQSAFGTIASEMTNLAESIEQANDETATVVTRLLQLLPEVRGEAADLHAETQRVCGSMDARATELQRQQTLLSRALSACRAAGRQRLPAVLEASERALQHLGVHDEVSRRLYRIDVRLWNLRVSVLKRLGLDTPDAEPVAATNPS
ncbi:MAG: hypothetical protein KTR31_32170 [Myxococcales bacterium]|nr:hypothetical protein [Myxococcales bacterium]